MPQLSLRHFKRFIAQKVQSYMTANLQRCVACAIIVAITNIFPGVFIKTCNHGWLYLVRFMRQRILCVYNRLLMNALAQVPRVIARKYISVIYNKRKRLLVSILAQIMYFVKHNLYTKKISRRLHHRHHHCLLRQTSQSPSHCRH